MIALLQRVTEAEVRVAGQLVGRIDTGLAVLVCAEPADDESVGARLLDRLLTLRVFADAQGKTNLSLTQVAGGLLLIPQFTLAADTKSGTRPSFSGAADPALGRRLFDALVARATATHTPVASGVFGASMQVTLTNDGPFTLSLRV